MHTHRLLKKHSWSHPRNKYTHKTAHTQQRWQEECRHIHPRTHTQMHTQWERLAVTPSSKKSHIGLSYCEGEKRAEGASDDRKWEDQWKQNEWWGWEEETRNGGEWNNIRQKTRRGLARKVEMKRKRKQGGRVDRKLIVTLFEVFTLLTCLRWAKAEG